MKTVVSPSQVSDSLLLPSVDQVKSAIQGSNATDTVVEVTPAQVLLHIQNEASPFTLSLGLDGALAGEGIAQVNGRLLTAATSAGPQFAATSARCPIGQLTAKTGH